MKRILTEYHYRFLEKELNDLEKSGELQDGQAAELLGNYVIKKSKVKRNINPMHILLVIGSILIGLSILSFVASNWSQLSNVAKYLLLFFTLIGFYITGFKLENKNKILSRVFYYIGAFAYGAEIIYIGQMFHLGGEIETALLFWGLGILPLGFHLKDFTLKIISLVPIYISFHIQFMFIDSKMAYMMILIIPLLFAFGHFVLKKSTIVLLANFIVLYEFIQIHLISRPLEADRLPIEAFVVIPILFYVGHRLMNKSVPLFIVNLFLSLEVIWLLVAYFDGYIAFFVVLLLFFIIGLFLTYVQHSDYKIVMKVTGLVIHFITGVALTFEYVWWDLLEKQAFELSLGFTLFYFMYNLYNVKKGNLFNVFILSVLIFRFYVDLSLAFMDKSIAFLLGGLLLIGLGYWFERTRKREVKKHEKA